MAYFINKDPRDKASYLQDKAQNWYSSMSSNGYLEKIRRSWKAYYGDYYGASHEISFGGEDGELVNIPINHYKNIGKNILNMVTATRPSFQPRSINTDRKSQIQTKLASGLLDYYLREKRLERCLVQAVESAIVLGTGYIKMEWDSTKGKIYGYVEIDPDTIDSIDDEGNYYDAAGKQIKPTPIYDGDVVFKNVDPFNICFDTTKENYEENDWVLVRTFINKYDLAAKYPEFAEEIELLETKSDMSTKKTVFGSLDETVDVALYECFHKPTPSVPNGNYFAYLSPDIILVDEVMPYDQLPVYRISCSNILGSPLGHTDMFDLLPMQEAINSLYSIILTNQSAFGVQNIISPLGAGIKLSHLEGGMNHIEYMPVPNASGGGKPEALELVKTPAEIFSFISMLVKDMETISGVNAVARGNADAANLRSGNALALVQQMALQYMSGLQRSYIQLIEDVGTGLVKLLKVFASTPRIADISGLSNITEVKEFTGDDLSSINRVSVDVGNSLAQTGAGKAEIATNLIQMGLITSPEKYLQVLNTGNLDTMVEGEMDELLQIRHENEALLKGEEVSAVFLDKHSLHIREHRSIIADPVLRKDVNVLMRLQAHLQEHIDLLQTTDPNILALIGEQPLSPPGGSPVAPGTVQPDQPTNASMAGNEEQLMGNPQAQSVAVNPEAEGIPKPAQPPGEFASNPTTPEQMFMQNAGG